MRRALAGGLCALLVLVLAAPVEAAPAETTRSLRTKRQVLVQRIASLTDEAVRAELRATDAERRWSMTAVALDETRSRFARYAVDAYVDGIQEAQLDRIRRQAWADALAATDLEILGELQIAKESAERQQAAAEAALSEARATRAELDGLRKQLERTIADRVRYERALAQGAARARAASSLGLPRHRRATMSQHELMQRYRFGPTTGIPEGLAATGQAFEGKASWYGPGFDGRPTASGAIFDQEGWTVAHRTLPLGTILLISRGDRAVVALVNDRGPFVGGRVLDLSHGVANALGTVHAGVAVVRAEILVPE